jgi:hypothetical protein
MVSWVRKAREGCVKDSSVPIRSSDFLRWAVGSGWVSETVLNCRIKRSSDTTKCTGSDVMA